MDAYSSRRATVGPVASRKGLKISSDKRDQDGQFCTRIGCSGRLNYSKSYRPGSSEKPNYTRPSNGKGILGSSSRTSSVTIGRRKLQQESDNSLSSRQQTDLSESSTIQDGLDLSEVHPSPNRISSRFQSVPRSAESGKVPLCEVGCSSGTSSIRSRRVFHQKSGIRGQNTLIGSPVSLTTKSNGIGPRNSGNGFGLKNLKCNSISDVLPQTPPSESKFSRKETVKKRVPEGESSSSSRGKKSNGTSSREDIGSVSTRGISISDSRRTRYWSPSSGNGAASVRSGRLGNANARVKCSIGHDLDMLQVESTLISPQVPRPETPLSASMRNSSHRVSSEASSSESSPYSPTGSDTDDSQSVVPFSSSEFGVFMNHDSLRRYNIDGVAEVLLALERLEHDEALSYEQLLTLETNLLLTGLNFQDQHSGMRMDIDNMSYEELLALGERMGTVSTALSEDEMSKCLWKSIYQATHVEILGCCGDEYETKCSICQEEYVAGDETASLGCEHGYHLACIQQWLRLKNWCPICKASAASSRSPGS